MEKKEVLKELYEHYNNINKLLNEGKYVDKKYLEGKADGLLMAIEITEDDRIPLF